MITYILKRYPILLGFLEYRHPILFNYILKVHTIIFRCALILILIFKFYSTAKKNATIESFGCHYFYL